MRRIFETGLEKLGRIIASQHNIKVVFRGQGASTDGKVIYLPSTTELTPELMADMHGFLDHEVAHCRFTDFKELERLMPGRGGRFQKDLLNACEDSRIEILQIEDLPGCRLNLEPLNAKYRKLAEDKIRDPEGGVPWPMKLIFALRAEMDGREPILDAETQELFDKVKGDVELMKRATSTKMIREAAEVITRKVLDALDEEKKDEADQGDGQDDQQGDGEKKEGQASGQGGKGENRDSEASKDEGEGEGEGQPGEGGEGRDRSADAMMDEGAASESKAWEAVSLNVDDMMEKELAKHFKQQRQKPETRAVGGTPDPDRTQTRGRHVPFTTEYDKVEDLTGVGDKGRYRTLRMDARKLTNPIKTRLEQLLKVKENAKWRTDREHGAINARSLPKLVTDRSFKTPFRERVKNDTNNVAVEILIDSSGSMHPKMQLAKQAVIAMGEALKELQIPFEVTGFTCIPCGQMARAAMAERLPGYNRVSERLEHRIFKSFDSDDLTGIVNLEAGGNNCDPESVRWAANRLSLMPQKRKILMVFSDGQPATGDSDMRLLRGALKDTVDKIMASGMEVVGFGIMSEAVREFYKDHLVINNIQELPTTAMGKLSKLLTK